MQESLFHTRACWLPRYSTYAINTFINYSNINYSNLAILPREIYVYILNLDIVPPLLMLPTEPINLLILFPMPFRQPIPWRTSFCTYQCSYACSDIVSGPAGGDKVTNSWRNRLQWPSVSGDIVFFAIRSWGMWVPRLFIREPVTGPTSDCEYQTMLCLGYSVLGDVVSQAIHKGTGCCPHQWLWVSGDIVSWLFGPGGGG